MPGNKNSGRKKKEVGSVERNEPQKRKRGRPKGSISKPQIESSSEASEPVEGTPLTPPLRKSSPLARVSTNVMKLSSRNSEITEFYDQFIGEALDQLPLKRLPTKRTLLQRFRALRSASHNLAQTTIVTTIADEVMKLWDCGAIPRKKSEACTHDVKKVVMGWVNSKKEEKVSQRYQRSLDSLLDLRPVTCSTLPALKKELKRLRGTDDETWLEDYNFFKGQMKHPQEGQMAPNKDRIFEEKSIRRAVREEKTQAYLERMSTDAAPICEQPCSSRRSYTTSVRMQVSEENIISKRRRSSSEAADTMLFPAIAAVNDGEDEGSTSSQSQEDEDWMLPTLAERKLRQRPENITLTLPAKNLPSVLARTSTMTKTSIRHELETVSTLVTAGDGNIDDCSLSKSTIQRQRKSTITSDATKMRERIKSYAVSTDDKKFLVLHWDGKIIQYITGEKEERLAIAVSSPNYIPGQFLASPAIADGTGLTMANCVHSITQEYGFLSQVEAMVFDTTASNTGKWKGSVARFEKMVKRQLLWLACRHHIPELFIKHASISVRGETDAPTDPLFKDFKQVFGFINIEERTLWAWPVNQDDWRFQRADEVLVWATKHMEVGTFPREDYRELIELVAIFLGGEVKRVRQDVAVTIEPSIRKPGAIHRARFMASCLYLLKIYLYQEQYDTTPENIHHVAVLAEYVALLHAPYFLKAPLAISAPRQDRDFWVDVQCYQRCFSENDVQHEMLTAVLTSIMNHLWYLSQELVIFALFDDNLSDDDRKMMALKLLASARPTTFKPGKRYTICIYNSIP